MPFQYKLGIMRMRFIYIIVLMASTFGAPFIVNLMGGIDLSVLAETSALVWRTVLLVLSAIVLAVSACYQLIYTIRKSCN